MDSSNLMKIYDQKGKWGEFISLQQIHEIAIIAQVEEDDFTIELSEKDLNIEISVTDLAGTLDVWIYQGSNLEPDKYEMQASQISTFIASLHKE